MPHAFWLHPHCGQQLVLTCVLPPPSPDSAFCPPLPRLLARRNCSADNGNNKKCVGATCSPLGGCTGLKCFGAITGSTPFAGQACFYDGSSGEWLL